VIDTEQLIARLLLAPSIMIALAIVVKGYSQPGDGFAAGTVMSLGLLVQYVTFGLDRVERVLPVNWLLRIAVTGCTIGFAVAFLPLIWGDPVLSHWPGPDDEAITVGILEVGTVLVFDVGVALLVVGAITGILAIIGAAADEGAAP
jgi:multisubunit Na+/H+ antiporter MnhB subunit